MKREKTFQLSFVDLQLQRRKVKSEFFNQINAVIDWRPLRNPVEMAYGKGNSTTVPPCHDIKVLFRMELMRVWYGLSGGEVEEQVKTVFPSAVLPVLAWTTMFRTAQPCAVSVTPRSSPVPMTACCLR